MSRSSWLVGFLMRGFPRRFALARATRLPVIDRVVDRALFGGDDIMYLPQDRVVEVGRVIEPAGQTFLPSQAAEHFIERSGHRFIMDWCICRKASGCKDYPLELGCLFLGEATLKIDPSLGHMATKEEAKEHLRKCREAGLAHLVGRNKLDSLWLGTGQEDRLLTICNCCPCCCLWKILPSLAPAIGSKVTKMPGLSIEVTDRCTGCGACAKTCFMNAITIEDGRAVIGDQCRGCGRCAVKCPRGAIEVRMGDLDEAVRRITAAVDVT
ncbi:MAG: CoB--CoM heterodisulfide reductase iron-sulfur subunit A [Methanocella sp. PtaU1.Bin125]|nr:MAG: CoB--CoM heterodisulfide reductase iron-sulfur subunit A [Methanocella sp. PtaU1.Bin125]